MFELGLELDAVALGRVDVQEGEIALAQRDQVAAGAEVGLGLDRLAAARDGEAELEPCASIFDGVPVGLARSCRRAGAARSRPSPSTVRSAASVYARPSRLKSAKTR